MYTLIRLAIVTILAASVIAAPSPARVEALFMPADKCMNAIVTELAAAKKSVRIQAYAITSEALTSAILDAHRRGCKVQAVCDSSNQFDRHCAASLLKNAGVDVRIDESRTISDNKIILIDDAVVISGSFDLIDPAQQASAENAVIIRESPPTVRRFAENWQRRYEMCASYNPAPPLAPAKGVKKSPTSQPTSSDSEGTVFVTKSGKRYHRQGCRSLKGGGQPMELAAAKADGRTPCKVCRPPS